MAEMAYKFYIIYIDSQVHDKSTMNVWNNSDTGVNQHHAISYVNVTVSLT